MAFGEGYIPMESGTKLDDGIYTAKIVDAEGVDNNGRKYVKCTIKVDGKNVYPNMFFINDSPKEGGVKFTKEQLLEMWCKSTTSFFDSFKIARGNFNFKQWVGCEGTITVRQQKNHPEYSEIVPYETSFKKKESAPQNNAFASAPSDGFGGNSAASDAGFSEDIPF